MGLATGRAATAAGQGLTSIGQLLLGIARENQARTRYENDPLRRLQIAIANREAAENGIFEGPEPQLFEPAPVSEIAPPIEMDPRLAGEAGVSGGTSGLGVHPDARAGMGMRSSEPMPRIDVPEIPASVIPKGEFRDDPDLMDVGGGYHARTPDAQRRHEQGPIRNHIGIIARAGSAIDTPEEVNAAAALAAGGQDVGALRRSFAPERDIPYQPTTREQWVADQRILAEIRADPTGNSLTRDTLVGLRMMIANVQEALSTGLEFMPGGLTPERRDAIIRSVGPWKNAQEYEDAVALFQSHATKALTGKAPASGPGSGTGPGAPTGAPAPPIVLPGGNVSFMDLIGGGRAPLSEFSKNQARTDPAYAAWLTKQGYSEADWR